MWIELIVITELHYLDTTSSQLPGFGQVQSVLSAARRVLGESLTTFEFMDRNAIATVRRAQPHLLKRCDHVC